MTLRLRLLLVLVGIVAVGLVIADVVTYTSLQSYLGAQLDQQLQSAPGPVNRALQICLNQQQFAPFTACQLPGGTDVAPGTYGQLRSADGHVLLSACFFNGRTARKNAHFPSPLPVSTATQTATVFTLTHTGCGATAYRAVAVEQDDDIVVAALPLTDENQTLGRLLRAELLVSLGVLLGLGILSWWVVRRGLRPLDEMTITAGAIASGDLSQRVPASESHTEVGRLGVALNTMLSEIEGAFAARTASEERLRRFLADASHELRTPLTSIRGYAEIFDRGAAERPEDLATSMRHIRSEANRMSELVDDLLLLARLDRERPLAHEQVEFTAVVAVAVDAARVKAPDRLVSFTPLSPVVVTGDASRLRQVIDNLLANALSHTPAGTPVEVAVRAEGDTALLTVADRGPGIAPADQEHIFEPFHRADPSRARATGGVGLGLAIVSAIATAHGGTVGVDSAPGAGATFWVRIPLAQLHASAGPARPAGPAARTARGTARVLGAAGAAGRGCATAGGTGPPGPAGRPILSPWRNSSICSGTTGTPTARTSGAASSTRRPPACSMPGPAASASTSMTTPPPRRPHRCRPPRARRRTAPRSRSGSTPTTAAGPSRPPSSTWAGAPRATWWWSPSTRTTAPPPTPRPGPGPTASALPVSSPWPSSTARPASITGTGSTAGTGPSRRCRPNSNPGPATSATRSSAPSPPTPPRSTASSRRPGPRPDMWPTPCSSTTPAPRTSSPPTSAACSRA